MDRHVVDDVRAPHAFKALEQQGRRVRRTDLTFAVQDHSVRTDASRHSADPAATVFTDATRAYQGAGRGVSAVWIEQLAAEVQNGLNPDCTLLLDLPVSVGLERVRQRSGPTPTDRFEEEPARFFERVREAYLGIARAEPDRVRVINATGSLDDVQRQIEVVLQSLTDARA
jgi:hypothetical protein